MSEQTTQHETDPADPADQGGTSSGPVAGAQSVRAGDPGRKNAPVAGDIDPAGAVPAGGAVPVGEADDAG